MSDDSSIKKDEKKRRRSIGIQSDNDLISSVVVPNDTYLLGNFIASGGYGVRNFYNNIYF